MSISQMRTSGLCAFLAGSLLACGTNGEGGGGGSEEDSSGSTSSTPTGSSTDTPSGDTTAGSTTSTVATEATASDGPTSTSVADSGSTRAGTDTGSDTGSTSGGSSVPIDCDDGGLPVRVDGGGGYETVSEGVAAVPPGGTLWVCPGDYEEHATMQIERDISIVGAGPNLVSIVAGAEVERLFFVRNASVAFEGFSISGALFGIDVSHVENAVGTTTMRNLRISGSQRAGVYLFTTTAGNEGTVDAVFEDVIVENVTSADGQAIAGVALQSVNATFLNTTIRDNVTRAGGLDVFDSEVTFEGGQVVRNEALFPNGGGARIVSDVLFATFTIIDSDWGEGAAEENVPNDVDCGAGANNDIGWLGNPANAVCATDTGDCCTPQ